MSVQYGKIEARIKLPKTANGLWPAFWMLGSNISNSGFGWPTCGEIDILEMGSSSGIKAGTQERYFNGALHWGYYTGGNYPNYARSLTNTYSLQDDFHLYTCEWDANSIKMYLDKDKNPSVAPYFQMNISSTNDDRGGQYDGYNYFRHPFFVIFNLAIGGNFPGIFNIDNITALNAGDAKMYIDFIKVYQKDDAGENYTGPALIGEDCDGGTGTAVISINHEDEYTSGIEITQSKDGIYIFTRENLQAVELYSISGLLIRRQTNNIVQTADIPKDIYLLKVVGLSGNQRTFKVII
jgi:beta-glucanase (GH16 family)